MRHLTRHTHQTIVDKVTALLGAGDWLVAPCTFGATPVTVQAIAPAVPQAVEPNTVGVTIDHPGAIEEAETGDGLKKITYMLYVDVYGEKWSTTMAICDDLRDGLTYARILVHDYSTGLDTTNMIEIDDVHIDEPPAAGAVDRSTWRVVTASIDVYFTG